MNDTNLSPEGLAAVESLRRENARIAEHDAAAAEQDARRRNDWHAANAERNKSLAQERERNRLSKAMAKAAKGLGDAMSALIAVDKDLVVCDLRPIHGSLVQLKKYLEHNMPATHVKSNTTE